MSEDTRPFCNWPLDGQGYARLTDMAEPEGGCRLPLGLKGWVIQQTLVDEYGHTVESDDPTQYRCIHKDTPEWRKAHERATPVRTPKKATKKEIVMAEQLPVPNDPKELTASVAVPSMPSAADLSKLASDAGGGVNGVLMALIAVVGGGGAIWKYLQSRDKAKAKQGELDHELRMKELELKAEHQQKQDDQHGQCKTDRAVLAAKVDDLESHLLDLHSQIASTNSKLEESKSSFAFGKGSDEIEEKLVEMSKRISKVETRLKAKKV
jgi:hypothetical protein